MIEKPPSKPPKTQTAVVNLRPSGAVATTLAARPAFVAGQPEFRRVIRYSFFLFLGMVTGGCGWLFISNGPQRFENFFNIFLGLVLEVVPFLLLGAVMAAILESVGNPGAWANRLWQKLNRNRAGAAAGGVGLGFFLPVCECGTASVARQLNREGAPITFTLVFLLAAPVVNPITILTTWLAFGGDAGMVFGRVGLALLVALVVGLVLSVHPRPQSWFTRSVSHNHHHSTPEHEHSHTSERGSFGSGLTRLVERTMEEFLQAARVALPGIALAAVFQAYFSARLFMELGQGAMWSVLALLLLGSLMSVCSSVDAFVVLAFAGLFPAGAVLAFLVFCPLINLKSLFLMRLVLNWRAIGLIALLAFQLILLVAVGINLRS